MFLPFVSNFFSSYKFDTQFLRRSKWTNAKFFKQTTRYIIGLFRLISSFIFCYRTRRMQRQDDQTFLWTRQTERVTSHLARRSRGASSTCSGSPGSLAKTTLGIVIPVLDIDTRHRLLYQSSNFFLAYSRWCSMRYFLQQQ
jgi:hypothetical protein